MHLAMHGHAVQLAAAAQIREYRARPEQELIQNLREELRAQEHEILKAHRLKAQVRWPCSLHSPLQEQTVCMAARVWQAFEWDIGRIRGLQPWLHAP